MGSEMCIRDRRSPFYRVGEALAVPLAASLATAPVLLAHFHTLPLLSVPVNALIGLVYPVFMVSGSLVAVLSALGLRWNGAAWCVDRLADFIDAVSVKASSVAWSNPSGLYLTDTAMIVICISIVILAIGLNMKRICHRLTSLAIIPVAALLLVLDGGQAQAADVVIQGGRRASDIRVRDLGRGYVVPLTWSKPSGPYFEAYYLSGGANPDSVRTLAKGDTIGNVSFSDGVLRCHGLSIVVAARDSVAMPQHAQAVVLTSRFRRSLQGLVGGCKVEKVVVAADMEPDRADAYIACADSLGIETIDLRHSVFKGP